MNNQFATQFLLQETEDEYSSLESILHELGTSEEAIKVLMSGVRTENITPEGAIEIAKLTVNGVQEMSTTGGGVTGGPTAAAWDPQGPTGTGEQMATTKAFGKKKKYQEDAPRLAGDPSKTNKQGTKNLTTYKNFGFTKAPSAEEAGKRIKGVQVKMLWKEGETPAWSEIEKYVLALAKKHRLGRDYVEYMKMALEQGLITKLQDLDTSTSSYLESLREELSESRAYSRFKKEAAIRPRDQQMHEAVKMIHKKLEEVSKLVEFAQQMRDELSEGDQALEYKHNTKKIFEKINSKVVEVYTKTRQLK